MPSKNIGNTVRGITRKAFESGKLDHAAVRRVTGEVRKSLKQFERSLARDLRLATRAGKDAASQSINATLASSAMAARAAAGMFAGIAETLAHKKTSRRR